MGGATSRDYYKAAYDIAGASSDTGAQPQHASLITQELDELGGGAGVNCYIMHSKSRA